MGHGGRKEVLLGCSSPEDDGVRRSLGLESSQINSPKQGFPLVPLKNVIMSYIVLYISQIIKYIKYQKSMII